MTISQFQVGVLLQKNKIMKRKKICIIGGGITGCTLAKILSKFHKVTIFERKPNLGGILEEYKKKNNFFLRGCQYIDFESPIVKFMSKKELNEFYVFNQKYFSYNKFNNQELFSKNYAVPVFFLDKDKLKKIKTSKKSKRNNLNEKIEEYPDFISLNLKKFYLKLGLNLEELTFENCFNFQTGKVGFINHVDKIKEFKNKSKLLDDLYAIPRKKLDDKLITRSILPKKGFNTFFKNFENNYSKKIKIIKKSNIRPKWDLNNLKIINNSEITNFDKIVWTGNPTYLIKEFNGNKLNSIPTKILQISADVVSSNKNNYFGQFYSDELEILRVFIYKLNKTKKINIECIPKIKDQKKVASNACKILSKYGVDIKINFETLSSFLDVRFNLISTNDKQIIENFNKKTIKTNLLNSPWTLYGRDQKLNYYIEKLKREKLL